MQNQGKKYNLIAGEFDKDRNKSLREKKYLDSVIGFLSPNDHVLDVGCGMGEPIAKYFIEKRFHITGIDASSALLEMSKKRFPQMDWLLGDMRTIEIKNKLQAIIAYDSFFHLPIDDQSKMIKRFAEWLHPQGILLLTTGPEESEVIDAPMHGHLFSYYSMSPENYRNHFNENGFKIILCEEDQPHHLVWILQQIRSATTPL